MNAKIQLSRESIITAALSFTEQHDVDSLSFRKLAETLEVSAMALYRHFENKQELLTATLDAFIEQANVLPDECESMGWASWIEHVAIRMYDALISQPSWLPLLGQLPLQQSGLNVLDACLEQLENSGFNKQQAVDAFFSMLHVLFGAAICQQQLNHASSLENTKRRFEFIENANEQIINNMQGRQIDLGLKILIAGLRAQRQG